MSYSAAVILTQHSYAIFDRKHREEKDARAEYTWVVLFDGVYTPLFVFVTHILIGTRLGRSSGA